MDRRSFLSAFALAAGAAASVAAVETAQAFPALPGEQLITPENGVEKSYWVWRRRHYWRRRYYYRRRYYRRYYWW
jgi:hypothetical protein